MSVFVKMCKLRNLLLKLVMKIVYFYKEQILVYH